MHCHTYCKQASNLHDNKAGITQSFFKHYNRLKHNLFSEGLMTHHLSTCMLAPYVTMHLKEKKVWGSHKIRVIFVHSMWLGIQKLKCFENNSVFWSTGVFWKHFSSLMHCHTWCKQASNLHEDKEWITQPFSCTDWKKCEVNEWWHQGEWTKNI